MTEKQKAISDLLRGADKVIKSGKLEEAMKYINKVIELDQRNVYAKAYTERIISLMEAQGISRSDALRITAQAKFTDADNPLADTKPEAKVEPAKVSQPAPATEKKETISPPAPEPVKIISPPPVIKPSSPIGGGKTTSPIKRTAVALEAYKALLLEIWRDGAITDEEQSRVDSMRETFAISHEEHAQIEKEVRLASYLNAIRHEWQKGVTNFEPLKQRYNISSEEQNAVEPKIMQLIQSLQSNGSVLVLDDDVSFLSVIKQILQDGGYYCFVTTTGEEGLQVLESMTPDIVLCDINFSKPHMSGFAFYERFRSIDRFLITPFIFLSALDQDVLIRTGKKLGADDYMTKPIDTEMLLATIEGKLRRSRELKRILE